MKAIIVFLTLLITFSLKIDLFAQGCSDAGFCTLNTIKEHTTERALNTLNFGVNYGKGDHSINNYGAFIEYQRNINEYISLTGKLNFAYINGELGSTSGLSDFFLSTNYVVSSQNNSNTNVTIGFKIPLSDGNKKIDNMPVPMDYQPSLGTFDIILGLNHTIERFGIGVAYQQPLNKSKNQFLPSRNSNPLAQEYFPSNDFERSGDVLLRASYSIPLSHNIMIRPSILPIYHLSDDKYTDANGNVQTIADSKGLTVNVNLFLNFALNNRSSLEFSFGAPIKTKTAHPDGLKRGFAGGVLYGFNF